MKLTFLSILFVFLSQFGRTQNIDSLLAEAQVIDLSISTPQPRLSETFQISIDISHLKVNIFKSLFSKVQLSNDISNTDNSELTINVKAFKKGKNEIGPLAFFLNDTKYTTNKISYEVIEPLPDIDNGIWFRKVSTNDSTFCIIIEQRIPANRKTTKKSESSTLFTTEPEYNEILKFKDSYSIIGLSGGNSHINTNFSSVNINGEERQFMYSFSVYNFNIINSKAKIKISKDKFQNIPDYYKFQDIIIQ